MSGFEGQGPAGDDDRPLGQEEAESIADVKFYNTDAEAALLGGLMIDNRFVAEVSERLKEDDFYVPVHGRIYRAIVRLVGNGKSANPVTLRPLFALDADLNSPQLGFGGPGYLATLTGSGAAILGIRDFAEQIVELARMRSIHEAMVRSLYAMQSSGYVADSVDELEQAIWEAADRHRPIRVIGAGDMIGLAKERIAKIQATASASVGAMCRTIPELNSLLGGLEAGQYTILAGRPSMGKSTTALSAAWGYAANGHPVLYAHAEMSSDLIALKVAADISYSRGRGILFQNIKKGMVSRADQQWLDEAQQLAEQLPLRYADIGRADVKRLDAIVARECAYWESRGRKLEVVFVDYIGLLQVDGTKAGDDRVRVSRISKALLDIAQKYGVHVVALAQLSRALEQRSDKRPMLSDLRDSGDLEQDADQVVFVYRHEWYLEKEKPTSGRGLEQALVDWEIDMTECRGKVELIAEKNRLGARGYRKARFHGDFSAVRGLQIANDDDDPGEDLFANWGGKR